MGLINEHISSLKNEQIYMGMGCHEMMRLNLRMECMELHVTIETPRKQGAK